MASVVFLRGVNVGGHKSFQPSALAKALADYGAVNIGAAGTFVIREDVGQRTLRTAILEHLPFAAEIMICSARELRQIAADDAFPAEPMDPEAKQFISVLAKRPETMPAIPLRHPNNDDWQVAIARVTGPFALSWWRRVGPRLIYPNEVVEKQFGVPATTRNWNTVAAICKILNDGKR